MTALFCYNYNCDKCDQQDGTCQDSEVIYFLKECSLGGSKCRV